MCTVNLQSSWIPSLKSDSAAKMGGSPGLPLWETALQLLKKLKTRSRTVPNDSTPRHLSAREKTTSDPVLSTDVHDSFICDSPQTGNTQMSSPVMESQSAMKKNEVLTLAKTEMKLKRTALTERSQTQRTTYCVSPFMTFLEKAHLPRQKTRNGRKDGFKTDRRDISEAMGIF